MNFDLQQIIEQFVDYLVPELTPAESAVYLFLLRKSYLENESPEIRIGKRTIAQGYGKGSRGERTNLEHIRKLCNALGDKGCIQIGDVTRSGTLFTVLLPGEIPLVKEKLSITAVPEEEDFFTDPTKRADIFERDNWTCHYCGERVNEDNASLDHYIPQCKGGGHEKENLKTSCLICNSIKSGKTFEEAAPLLLESIRNRRSRPN